ALFTDRSRHADVFAKSGGRARQRQRAFGGAEARCENGHQLEDARDSAPVSDGRVERECLPIKICSALHVSTVARNCAEVGGTTRDAPLIVELAKPVE